MLYLINTVSIFDIVDIIIIWFLFYLLIRLFRGTRSLAVLRGIIILLVTFLIAKLLKLSTISWILQNTLTVGVLAIFILFKDEIRSTLAKIGERNLFSNALKSNYSINWKAILTFLEAAQNNNTGVLIVFERNIGLKNYIESGVKINANISKQLLESLFNTASPLHDGAVIIHNNLITAAACILPLYNGDTKLNRHAGTRHSAAFGITVETDAIVVVVSEENGAVSLIYKENIKENITPEKTVKYLKKLLSNGKNQDKIEEL